MLKWLLQYRIVQPSATLNQVFSANPQYHPYHFLPAFKALINPVGTFLSRWLRVAWPSLRACVWPCMRHGVPPCLLLVPRSPCSSLLLPRPVNPRDATCYVLHTTCWPLNWVKCGRCTHTSFTKDNILAENKVACYTVNIIVNKIKQLQTSWY